MQLEKEQYSQYCMQLPLPTIQPNSESDIKDPKCSKHHGTYVS